MIWTEGLTYRKWGEVQKASAGDWLVDNGGGTYTVEQLVFEQTYSPIGPGQYIKSLAVWAHKAEQDGSITTREGKTHYQAGDMIVFNNEDETDGYADFQSSA